MVRFAVLAVLAAAVLAVPTSASAKTREQAVQDARACLIKHGMTRIHVNSRNEGQVRFHHHGYAYWWYDGFRSGITNVSLNFYGHGQWDEKHRSLVKICVNGSL